MATRKAKAPSQKVQEAQVVRSRSPSKRGKILAPPLPLHRAPINYWVALQFTNLPASQLALVRLDAELHCLWNPGHAVERPVGMDLSTPGRLTPVQLERLTITGEEIQVGTSEAAPALVLQMFVQVPKDVRTLRGTVTLPSKCSVVIRAGTDETTVGGAGSWSLNLKAP